MKFKMKKFISVVLTMIIVLQLCISVGAYSYATGEINISKEATEYAYLKYNGLLEVVESQIEFYDIQPEQLQGAKLGKAFVIYELDSSSQDEIYYFPVLDMEENVILMLSVIGTVEGWSVTISEEWVSELNKLDYTSKDFIFYKTEESLYAENSTQKIWLAGKKEPNIGEFSKKSYFEKKSEINKSIKNLRKIDINSINDDNWKCKYTPAFSSSTSSSKMCSLYNAQGQGNYGLCWAACVATIYNYLCGNDITAMEVADDMGIGYNEGASTYEALLALQKFGVGYQNYNDDVNNIMSWELLRYNIDDKCPIYVRGLRNGGAHAVVVRGYTIAAGVRYISLWNPGLNSGNGGLVTVEFKDEGTTFTYGNYTYIWDRSVSEY